MYIYIHTNTHSFICIYTHTHAHIFLYVYTNTRYAHFPLPSMYTSVYMPLYVYIYVCVYMYICICAPVYPYIHLHTPQRTHIESHILTYRTKNKHLWSSWEDFECSVTSDGLDHAAPGCEECRSSGLGQHRLNDASAGSSTKIMRSSLKGLTRS